ncbi:YifB family Mg chelatase-like AAA ATPase [Heyndrickxia vini]|uniref:YifB family Mg chelatase-like AAA ATPase n=1 Tax=Heyndrickxia vini TaxID=1476025 RepID=A0ABX7E3B1_9BACI|nr:YifB family Mg chelatase-like AAA ATPase [Heyndrickxia vini]QQZ10201.1 YifB family Mg chelatase-like AAA ATPase [Heyndrickxia vini]
MASTVFTFTLTGIEGNIVEVETDILTGMPSVSIVGLGDKAIKEARERLEAAILHANYHFPLQRVIFNLAPSDMKKTGSHFDLAMAIGLLIRTNQIKANQIERTGFIGELSLNSSIRPVSGILPMAMKAKEENITRLIVAKENVKEARLVKGLDVYGCNTLTEVVSLLNNDTPPLMEETLDLEDSQFPDTPLDFQDVKGQEWLINFITIAAAGGHNFLMIGPPGCGKSMISMRIPSILPPLAEEESLEVMKIYSVANLLKSNNRMMTERPFRAPHHNASTNSIIGGGPFAMPGEISLAHHGVLFLDELGEFSRKTLDSLRQPLEDKAVTISRVWGSHCYPANFMLVGAMNPCPCGYFGQNRCKCTDYEVMKYRQKLSGPILDRMDIQKYVGMVDFFENETKGKSSSEIRKIVEKARKIQRERYKNIPLINCNAQLTPSLIQTFCQLDRDSKSLLRQAAERYYYSGRAIHKFIKIARTIADLEGEENIRSSHLRKSLQSRDMEKENQTFIGGKI